MIEMTESKRLAIDSAYGKLARGEDMSADDVSTMLEFERERAYDEAMASIEAEEMRKTAEANRELSLESARIARDNLKLTRDGIMAKYKKVNANEQK